MNKCTPLPTRFRESTRENAGFHLLIIDGRHAPPPAASAIKGPLNSLRAVLKVNGSSRARYEGQLSAAANKKSSADYTVDQNKKRLRRSCRILVTASSSWVGIFGPAVHYLSEIISFGGGCCLLHSNPRPIFCCCETKTLIFATGGQPRDEVISINERLRCVRARLDESYLTAKRALIQLHANYNDSKSVSFFRRYALLRSMIKVISRSRPGRKVIKLAT